MTVPLNTAKGPRDLLGHKSTPPSHLVCKRDGWFLFIFRKFKSSLHHPYIGFLWLYQKGRYNGNRNMKDRGKIMCYVFIDVQHSMSALTSTTSKIEGAKMPNNMCDILFRFIRFLPYHNIDNEMAPDSWSECPGNDNKQTTDDDFHYCRRAGALDVPSACSFKKIFFFH